MSIIAIEGIKVHAFHGCLPEEEKTGNNFIVDLFIETDTTAAEQSDELGDTVDYQQAINLVIREMKQRSKLLEHVAHRILEKLFLDFPEISSAQIKVQKLNPPVSGEVGKVSVIFEKRR